MKPADISSGLVESTERRTFLKAALGTAATAAAIPAVSSIASAHFPETLRIDITPGSDENEINPGEDDRISVAVLQTSFVDEAGILKEPGTKITFDPTERPVRYRFGTQELLEQGGGARPVGDGEVRDVNNDGKDDLVLEFPLDGTGFTGDETTGTLYWERPGTHHHGFLGTDDISLPNDMEISDVDILNYALTLEHLEAAFYHDFLDNHTESEVESSEVANYFARPTLQYSTYQQIEELHEHEHAHVEKLITTIENLGGNPVEAAEYKFPYDSIEEFVALADRIEAVGVSAYAGVAPLIDNQEVLEAALSIHSVEANHQTYFQLLNLQRPAPNAFNPARSMDQVLPIAKQFISSE